MVAGMAVGVVDVVGVGGREWEGLLGVVVLFVVLAEFSWGDYQKERVHCYNSPVVSFVSTRHLKN